MSDLGNRQVMSRNIQKYMAIRHKTRRDVAAGTGIPYSTLCEWINCNKYPRIDNIQRLAEFFGVDKSALIEDKPPSIPYIPDDLQPMPTTYNVPRLGRIPCGSPNVEDEVFETYDDVPDYIKADFTLECEGDSMIGARIYDGDIVCIHKDAEIRSGDIAAVRVDGEAVTLKRIKIFDDHLVLQPENPDYKPLSFWEEEMNTVQIIGKATHFISVVR